MTIERIKEIEVLAFDVLRKYNIRENPGKHLNIIVKGEGVELVDYHDWPEDICGRYIIIDDRPVIYYNAKHTAEMQAFTIAHELGHYFLEHLADAEPETICIDRDFQLMDDTKSLKAQREVEANRFAVSLLLPWNMLKPVFQEFMLINRRTGVLYIDKQRCNFEDYKKCMNWMRAHFLASESAIRYRLMNLGLMDFRIEFEPTEDRGVSIAEYLKRINKG